MSIKKVLGIGVITVITLVMCMSAVYAVTSFKAVLTPSATKVQQGGDVEVTINLKDFTAGETGINSIYFDIEYDTAIFETLAIADMTASSGWSAPTFNPAIGSVAMDNSGFVAENHDMLKIKFKVKESATVGNTTVAIKNIDAADGVNDIYPSDQKITLTIQEKATAQNTVEPAQNTVEPVQNTVVTNTATENPKTGIEDYTVPAILAVSILGIIAYVRYTKLGK